ncbi:uncharacterized protein BKCO1_300050 [Diplodia corticola]|uniref:DUF7580 domain-containing protein n=1 Tax=Diplodia corticola TaxID=236234 RepID=A0A1J9RFK4_9PEZI|nr:uncharacterized protein BKCO1_300050 [Diplodia corticola]OJD38858.1 hypothetical protein BKCO1_300050 [Diplodia corticola]
MSGVELAGLVLAVLPLVISALEDYNDGLDPVKAFVKWENYLPQYIRKLRNQHVHYEQTLRLLLAPITTEYELAEMIADPQGDLWKDPAMAKRLKYKLDESYDAYHQTIKDIERIMTAIAEKLDLERASSVSRNDLEAMLLANGQPKPTQKFEFKKRVRFSMNKKKVKRLLEELDECNKELERFTEKSEKLEPYRKSSKPSIALRLQKIQAYARVLHNTLVDAFSCSCKASHCANLHLENRDLHSQAGGRRPVDEPGTIFTVSFMGNSGSWVLRETQICCSEEDDDLSTKMSGLHVHRPRRSVSFSPATPPPPPKPSHSPLRTKSESSHFKEVKDLCHEMQSFEGEGKARIGFSMENGRLRGAYPVPLNSLRYSRKAETVTLEDILKDGAKVRLSKKDRYSLAVTVASSILQLHASPWIGDDWSKRDILFYHTASSHRSIDVENPHVSQKLMPLPGSVKPIGFSSKNTTLLALGIILLELYFGKPCEQQMPENLNMGPNKSLALLCTAHHWYETDQEDLSAAFQGAIAHCLRCFADPSGSLQDSEFLQAAMEQIVLPLQDELYQFLGTK